MENILSTYFCLKDTSEYFPLNYTVEISINNNLGEIRYTFPSTIEECLAIDNLWFCPALFSLLQIEDFYKILTAVLLERSLIFVSDNLTILSSVILGFKTLIKPFTWCYALIPILPKALLDILDTPQPVLVGITTENYYEISLSEEEKLNKTWIFLDEYEVKWG